MVRFIILDLFVRFVMPHYGRIQYAEVVQYALEYILLIV